MTWEELVKAVEDTIDNKALNVFNADGDYACFGVKLTECEIVFRRNGVVYVEFDIGRMNCGGLNIEYNRTYEQMYQIINALK